MSAVAAADAARARPSVADTWVIARRGLLHMRRQPEALADATIQPIMFVLLFAFVFGGAIEVPGGGSYREFLMGGIFAQTIVFGAFGVAIGARLRPHQRRDRPLPLAADAARGACSPATRSPSLVKSLLPIVLMSLAGLRRRLAHPRRRARRAGRLRADDRVLVRGHLGRRAARQRSSATPEAVQGVAFVAIFPITFVASTFVPVEHAARRCCAQFAEWNPVTALSGALRDLFGNPGGVAPRRRRRGRCSTRSPTR